MLTVTPPPLLGLSITGSLPVVRHSCAKSQREMRLCVCQSYLNTCFLCIPARVCDGRAPIWTAGGMRGARSLER